MNIVRYQKKSEYDISLKVMDCLATYRFLLIIFFFVLSIVFFFSFHSSSASCGSCSSSLLLLHQVVAPWSRTATRGAVFLVGFLVYITGGTRLKMDSYRSLSLLKHLKVRRSQAGVNGKLVWMLQPCDHTFLGGSSSSCFTWAMNKTGCLVYIGGYTTQLYRDYNKPL